MPALPVIANCYLVTQRFDYTGHERHTFVNVFGIRDNTGAATKSAIATKVANSYQASLLLAQTNGVVMSTTDVLPLDGVSSTQSFATSSVGATGGHATGNALPNAVAFVLAWQTGLRGRSKRGRSYIVGVTSDQLADPQQNLLTAGEVTTLTGYGNGFIGNLPGGVAPNLSLVVISRKLAIATPVTTCRADTHCGIQRRRYEAVARH